MHYSVTSCNIFTQITVIREMQSEITVAPIYSTPHREFQLMTTPVAYINRVWGTSDMPLFISMQLIQPKSKQLCSLRSEWKCDERHLYTNKTPDSRRFFFNLVQLYEELTPMIKSIRLWHKANKSLFDLIDIFCENNIKAKSKPLQLVGYIYTYFCV